MKINLIELKQIIDILFVHIVETGGIKECEIDQDLYWQIPDPEVYNLNDAPKEFHIGGLYDDWEFLSKILNPERQPLANQLTELAPILRYLGEYLPDKLTHCGG